MVKKANKKPAKNNAGSNKSSQKGNGNGAMKVTHVPFASGNVYRQPTVITRIASPFHPKWGQGVACTGRQYLTSVITTAGDSQLFSGNSPMSINGIYISPDAFNGRIALEARTFQRYLFTKLRFIYTPRVAVTQAGEFVLGYYSDPQTNNIATSSFATVQDSGCAVVSSFHNGGSILVWDVNVPRGIDDSYICELNTTTAADSRQTIQGMVQGFPDVTSIGAITMGNLSVEYEITFYCPTTDLGFSVFRLRDVTEADFLRAVQVSFRRLKDDQSALTKQDRSLFLEGLSSQDWASLLSLVSRYSS